MDRHVPFPLRKQPKSVRFTLGSDEKHEAAAAAVVYRTTGKPSDSASTGFVAEDNVLSSIRMNHGTVRDPRFGCMDARVVCPTCHESGCSGHSGVIPLADYVIRPGCIAFVVNVLTCVCFFCSKLRFEKPAKLEAIVRTTTESTRLKLLAKEMKPSAKTTRVCSFCGKIQPRYKYKRLLTTVIKYEFTGSARTLEPDEAWNIENCADYLVGSRLRMILDKVSDSDAEILGFHPPHSHPRKLVTIYQVVPPPSIRPINASGHRRHQMLMRGDDDLTRVLQSIVRANELVLTYRDKYREALETSEGVKEARKLFIETLVGLQLTTYFVFQPDAINSVSIRTFQDQLRSATTGISASPHVQRHRMGWKASMNGKSGVLRKYLLGKRVDHSARSPIAVASAVANMWSLGVPSCIMNTLTFPDRVTAFNLRVLQECVRLGHKHDNGATSVMIPESDRLVSLAGMSETSLWSFADRLQPGWVVRRHLRDGDICVFNRQPTLHRMSMMGFSIYRVPHSTFMLPIMDTTPFNADHDGDEMNLHMPQTYEAIAEILELMFVPKCIVTPQKNAAIIGLKQDAVLGWYLLSRATLTEAQDSAIRSVIQFAPGPDEPDLNVHLCPESWVAPDVPLRTGLDAMSAILPKGFEYHKADFTVRDGIASGVVTSAVIGTGAHSIPHVLFLRYGPWASAKFLSDANRVAIAYLRSVSASVGLRNCFEPGVGPTVQRILAGSEPKSLLGDMCAAMMAWAKTQDPLNGLVSEILSGAKGNQTNLTQILGAVGQQSGAAFRTNGRGIPLFDADDTTPESDGFVRSSYASGLTLAEFFACAQAGRVGLTDTAVKTARSGYIERCMMQFLKNVYRAYTGLVIDTNGRVMQFIHGNDDLDATYLHLTDTLPPGFEPRTEVQQWVSRNADRKVRVPMIDAVPGHSAVETLVGWFKRLYSTHNCQVRWTPTTILETLEFLRSEPCPLFNFACYVLARWDRAPANLDAIGAQYIRCVIAAGEPLGALAATSMSEPATQMTMKTFHQAGIENRNVTVGLKRFEELINSQGSNESSYMNISLKAPWNQCAAFAECVADSIIERTLESLMTDFDISVGPVPFVQTFRPGVKDPPTLGLGSLVTFRTVPHGFVSGGPEVCGAVPPPTRPETAVILTIVVSDLAKIVADTIQQYVTDAACVLAIGLKVHVWIPDLRYFCDRFSALTDKTKGALSAYCSDLDPRHHESFVRGLLMSWVTSWRSLVVTGIQDIRKAYVRETNGVFVVETEGSNPAVFSLPYVDFKHTYCSNATGAMDWFGVEACAEVLRREFNEVLSIGYGVDPRHYELLVDVMTQNGDYCALTRHNMDQSSHSLLQRAGFEETATVLIRGAAFGETDNLNGASRMMLGLESLMGTGICEAHAESSESMDFVEPLESVDATAIHAAEAFLEDDGIELDEVTGLAEPVESFESGPAASATSTTLPFVGALTAMSASDSGFSERAFRHSATVRRRTTFVPRSLNDFCSAVYDLRHRLGWTTTPSAWDFGLLCTWDHDPPRTSEVNYSATAPIARFATTTTSIPARVSQKMHRHYTEEVLYDDGTTSIVNVVFVNKTDVPAVTKLRETIAFRRCVFETPTATLTIRLETDGRTACEARRSSDARAVIELTTAPTLEAHEILALEQSRDVSMFIQRDRDFDTLWTEVTQALENK